ncbi:MAG: hypothetical protein K9J06_09630 [Flavobacteriales bacterium]|nr:hypothetical protein [Flavobacteriales bacterium]
MRTLSYAFAILAMITLSTGCEKDTPLLTPARKLEGTWKMTFPVTFYYETEYCDFSTMQLMATEKRLVTWVITEDSADPDGNTVRINMNYVDSDFTILQLCMNSTGITPEVRPMFLTGIINGDFLTIKSGSAEFGVFNFTTDNMEGNWDATTCSIWCQHVYTVQQEFKVYLQH